MFALEMQSTSAECGTRSTESDPDLTQRRQEAKPQSGQGKSVMRLTVRNRCAFAPLRLCVKDFRSRQFFHFLWHFSPGGGIDFARHWKSHIGMKHILFIAALICTAILTPPGLAQAQTNDTAPATSAAPSPADKEKATLEKHTKPILAALKLTDPDKEQKVRDIMAAQFKALHTWHADNDAQIKSLWNDFNKARSAHSVTNANAALDKISGVYAAFKPQHDKFLADLSSVLSPEQVEAVKDALTINKVKVTYDVYLQIFPTLTDAQKKVVLQDLKAAREEAIDCEAMPEKSAFFKKYKIIIEDDYLTAQGYDPKQARTDFAAKSKADSATKKAAE